MRSRIVLVMLALLIAPLVAYAQLTYRCVSQDGKKYYGSTIPPQCYGRPIEQINKQGTVVRRIDPEGDAKERAEKEASLAKKKEEDAATREEHRRNRALLATYTSEHDIEDARGRALADNRKAAHDVEIRLDVARKRRAGYDKELEFYKGDAKPPAKLAEDIQAAEIEIKANQELLAMKKKEVQQINARYDDDRKRYLELTRNK